MEFLEDKKLIIILGLLAAMGPLCIDMYIPGMLDVQQSLLASAADVQITLSAFLVGYAVGQLFYGPLSDRFGRKTVLISGICLFTFASLGAALSKSIEALIFFRFLHAIGGGAGMVLSRAIIRDIYPSNEVARLISLLAIVTMVGPMIAPIIGGYLVEWQGWRAIMWLLTGLGFVFLVIVSVTIKETHPLENRVMLNFRSTFQAYREVLADRRAFAYIACTATSAGGIFAYISNSPFVFIEIHGMSASTFGYVYAFVIFGIILGAFINTRLVNRVGINRMISYGLFVRLAGISLLLVTSMFDVGGVPVLILAFFITMSTSILINANSSACVLHLFPRLAGTASAVIGAIMFGCGAISGPVIGALYDGTIMPIVIVVTACFVASAVFYWGLVKPEMVV